MTIKQQGGIFGRNPNFNDVGVSGDLSVDGKLSSDDSMSLYVNNGTRLYLDGSGNATINTGNLVIGTSGKGIDFSATSGSGTSELFSDYEEGEWTPTLNAYSGTPTVSGYYVKIGQMVYVECSIALDGTSDSSGYIIKSLPFTMASPKLGGGAVNTNTGGETDVMVGYDVNGRIRLSTSSNGNQTYNSIGASSTITINAQYRAA